MQRLLHYHNIYEMTKRRGVVAGGAREDEIGSVDARRRGPPTAHHNRREEERHVRIHVTGEIYISYACGHT